MSLTLNDIDGLVRRLFDRASRVQPMSRLDSRQLDELVQATVDLQNRPREERRMRTVAFTAHVDECELAGLDSVTRAQIIESRWRELYLRMANHIAENLSANQYQLLRVVSDSGRNAIYSNRVVTMTLTLEVGQVTERPFVNVMAAPTAYTYPLGRDRLSPVRREDVMNVEREHGLEPGSLLSVVLTEGSSAPVTLEQGEATIRAVRNGAFNGGLPEPLFATTATPPTQKPDPVPHKRHILIDKKNKQ